MESIEKFLIKNTNKRIASKPIIFDLNIKKDSSRLKRIIKEGGVDQVVDDYKEQLSELFSVNNPGLVYGGKFKEYLNEYCKKLKKERPIHRQGKWIYFPWLSKLVHLLEEDDFHSVRTARNKNLIRKEEQDKFYNSTIGIGGLSIGNSIALAIVLKGGAKHIKIADMDRLSLSNINRIRSGVNNLGLLKTEMTARQIYEINPYSEVEIFSDGLNDKNLENFFVGKKKLDVFVDELDNMAIKYLIREYARRHRVPVLMSADNGDNAVIDVERYDKDPNIKFFHGRIGDASYEDLSRLDKFGIGKMITKHIGYENIPERMQESLMEMGKTIVSWPQLGNTALINGSIIAYLIRKIVNNQSVIEDRAIFSLDEKLIPGYYLKKEEAKRKKTAEYFKNIFNL
ncbi:MAG: UBA/THIF-type NAD/FAD binding fold protein [Parcubacteria group bacterium GW2011_GWF2_38_76]|nr:MAG: UBA/THIF-type NAD/FAD binding fold protein [Parcubacteria group bacterium GW2011_GWF2_38_76]HBM45713.1 hypothetical protein [Patescibacteria group bacterium]